MRQELVDAGSHDRARGHRCVRGQLGRRAARRDSLRPAGCLLKHETPRGALSAGDRIAYLQVLDPGCLLSAGFGLLASRAAYPSQDGVRRSRPKASAERLLHACGLPFTPCFSNTFSTCLGRVSPRRSSRSLPSGRCPSARARRRTVHDANARFKWTAHSGVGSPGHRSRVSFSPTRRADRPPSSPGCTSEFLRDTFAP